MAPYDRNSGSNKTGQAALPHKNIHNKKTTANWCTDRTNKVINPCQSITAARKKDIIQGLYSNWNKEVFVIDRNHITFKKSSTLPIEVPTRTGYVFTGFYTAKTGGTKIVNANGKIIVSKAIKQGSETGMTVQLYAQWTPYMLDDTSSILVNGITTFKKKKYNKLENGGLSSEK